MQELAEASNMIADAKASQSRMESTAENLKMQQEAQASAIDAGKVHKNRQQSTSLTNGELAPCKTRTQRLSNAQSVEAKIMQLETELAAALEARRSSEQELQLMRMQKEKMILLILNPDSELKEVDNDSIEIASEGIAIASPRPEHQGQEAASRWAFASRPFRRISS